MTKKPLYLGPLTIVALDDLSRQQALDILTQLSTHTIDIGNDISVQLSSSGVSLVKRAIDKHYATLEEQQEQWRQQRLLPLPRIIELSGLSRSTAYRRIQNVSAQRGRVASHSRVIDGRRVTAISESITRAILYDFTAGDVEQIIADARQPDTDRVCGQTP